MGTLHNAEATHSHTLSAHTLSYTDLHLFSYTHTTKRMAGARTHRQKKHLNWTEGTRNKTTTVKAASRTANVQPRVCLCEYATSADLP